jgi:hypothetical protein
MTVMNIRCDRPYRPDALRATMSVIYIVPDGDLKEIHCFAHGIDFRDVFRHALDYLGQ